MWLGFWKWSIETTHSLSAWVMSLENVGNALPLRGTPRLCFWDRWGFLHSCDWPNQLCMVYHDGLPTWLTIRQPKSAIHRTNPFPFPIFIYCDGKWNKFVIYRKSDVKNSKSPWVILNQCRKKLRSAIFSLSISYFCSPFPVYGMSN